MIKTILNLAILCDQLEEEEGIPRDEIYKLVGIPPEVVEKINSTHEHYGVTLPSNIIATHDLEHLAEKCNVLFPVVPSSNFRRMMKDLSPFLHPYHILIHGTKGLDLSLPDGKSLNDDFPLSRDNIKTMSEVITEESVTVRVGCLAGPNLAKEILQNQPAATVVASHFDEVIDIGQRLLRTLPATS